MAKYACQQYGGNSVEIGVAKGLGTHIIGSAYTNTSIHHVFDSFEGLSSFSDNDGKFGKEGQYKHSIESVKTNLRNSRCNIVYHKGVIPECFDPLIEGVTFAHIDVDLYEPTVKSIRYVDNLVDKGVIIIDDYKHQCWPGVEKAVQEHFGENNPVIHLPTNQGVWYKE